MNDTDYQLLARSIGRDCIAVRLRVLNRAVSGLYEEALRQHGIKISQMNILVAVAALATAKPASLCRILHMDPSTLSRNVERMKKKGWITAIPGEDERSHLLVPLPAGHLLLRDVFPAWEDAQDKAASLLGDAGTRFLLDIGSRLMGINDKS